MPVRRSVTKRKIMHWQHRLRTMCFSAIHDLQSEILRIQFQSQDWKPCASTFHPGATQRITAKSTNLAAIKPGHMRSIAGHPQPSHGSWQPLQWMAFRHSECDMLHDSPRISCQICLIWFKSWQHAMTMINDWKLQLHSMNEVQWPLKRKNKKQFKSWMTWLRLEGSGIPSTNSSKSSWFARRLGAEGVDREEQAA